MKNREIKVRYSDDSDILLVTYGGLDIFSSSKFNGCFVFFNQAGTVIGYAISSHSERPNVNHNLMLLLGQPAECLEGAYGLA